MNHSKATIREIAKKAGVSITTISRYLNGKYEYMSESTRLRIHRVIQEQDYRPDRIARSMKSKERKVIGCIIDDITNPIASIYVKAVTDIAAANQYSVLIANTDDDAEREIEAINHLLDNRVDGFAIVPTGKNSPYIVELFEQGLPIVLIDRGLLENGRIDTVCTAGFQATYDCMQMLWDQGFRKVGFFTPCMQYVTSRYFRYQGFCRAMEDIFHCAPDDYLFTVEKADVASCTEKLQEFLEKTKGENAAIFACNGVLMLSMLQTMQGMGIRLKSLGVCGFDDWGWAGLIGGGITTIVQESREVGIRATELLLERIREKSPREPKYIEIPNKLIVRGSTTIQTDLR